jgi:hypothetical protein
LKLTHYSEVRGLDTRIAGSLESAAVGVKVDIDDCHSPLHGSQGEGVTAGRSDMVTYRRLFTVLAVVAVKEARVIRFEGQRVATLERVVSIPRARRESR